MFAECLTALRIWRHRNAVGRISCPEAAFPGPAAQRAIQTPVEVTRSQGDDLDEGAQPRSRYRSDVKSRAGGIPSPLLAASMGDGEGARLGRRGCAAGDA